MCLKKGGTWVPVNNACADVSNLSFFFFPSSETGTIWTGAFGSSYISLLYFSPLLIVSITFISSGKLPWYTIETSSFQWGSLNQHEEKSSKSFHQLLLFFPLLLTHRATTVFFFSTHYSLFFPLLDKSLRFMGLEDYWSLVMILYDVGTRQDLLFVRNL